MGCKLDRVERNRRYAQLRALRQSRDRWRVKAESWRGLAEKRERRMNFEKDWSLYENTVVWVLCLEQEGLLNCDTEHNEEVLRHLKGQRSLLRRTKRKLFKQESNLIERGELDRETEGFFDTDGEFLEGLDTEQLLLQTFRLVALQAENEILETQKKLISN